MEGQRGIAKGCSAIRSNGCRPSSSSYIESRSCCLASTSEYLRTLQRLSTRRLSGFDWSIPSAAITMPSFKNDLAE